MDVIIFNVRELNQLLLRDLKYALGYTEYLEDAEADVLKCLEYWYRVNLYEFNSVLFKKNPILLSEKYTRLVYRLRSEWIHPAYESLLFRMVRVPAEFYETNVSNLIVTESELFIRFEKGSKKCTV